MQYIPRVKFNAALDASGNIVPGAAYPGYKTTTFDTTALGLYHCLLEDPATGNWEICRYDPAQASGSRRQTIYTGASGALASTLTGLTCSFVAHPNSYVVGTYESPGDTAPDVQSVGSTGVGANASVGAGSDDSLAVVATVRSNSPRSVAIGGWAGATESVALGYEASAESYVTGSEFVVTSTGSVAVGYRARTTSAGEVALGNAELPHMSGVPVMTDDPTAGGTFTFKPVGRFDGSAFVLGEFVNPNGTFTPQGEASGWVVHVQGVIVARATDPANDKVVKVEWVTGGSLTQTVLTNGANNISLGLALSGMMLQATVAAVGGLKLSGYLHLTKINW